LDALVAAWRRAGADLGIVVESPFSVKVGDESVNAIALVHEFGSEAGTIVLSLDYLPLTDFLALGERLKKLGYFSTAINPRSYVPYSRDRYVNALVDWGWRGDPAERPSWASDR